MSNTVTDAHEPSELDALRYEYRELDADYRAAVAQLEDIEHKLALQVRENHRNAQIMSRLFTEPAAFALVLRFLERGPELIEHADVVDLRTTIERVLDERDELRRRVSAALAGLDAAGVYEGTTARILRGTC